MKKFVLGSEAIDYVRKCLEAGNKLAELVLEDVELEKGNVITFFPSFVKKKELNKFDIGGKLSQPFKAQWINRENGVSIPSSIDNYLVSKIKNNLTNFKNGLCVFEDFLANPKDPCLSNKRNSIYVYKNDVYYFLFAQDVTKEKINQIIKWSSALPIHLGYIISDLKNNDFIMTSNKENTNLSKSELKIIVKRIKRIIVGAYDGEGYLIWSKKDISYSGK